jgi:hypothetical protein
MGNRRQSRMRTVVPVRLGGTDSSGKRFVAMAHTIDISHSGARIGGIVAELVAGEELDLQYHHRKARFGIAWVRKSGNDYMAGLKALEPSKDVWGTTLEEREIEDTYEPPKKKEVVSTRSQPRYQASASVDLITTGDHRAASAELQNLSRGGCYLKSFVPFEVGTRTELLIQLDGLRINAYGVVRSCHPGKGMGLRFTDFRTPEDKLSVHAKIAELAGEEASPRERKKVSEVSKRLQAATKELYKIEESMKSSAVDPGIFREFRQAVGQVRSTSWALQKAFELEDEGGQSNADLVAFLNTERIRLATRLCQQLCNDLKKQEIDRQSPHLADLLETVEDLFTRLAGFEFKMVDYGTRKKTPRA